MALLFRNTTKNGADTEAQPATSREQDNSGKRDLRRSIRKPALSPTGEAEHPATPGSEPPRARLSVDVHHATYVKVKTFAANSRKPVVAVIEELINSHCPV